jgi:hypothetical protein
MDPVKRNEREGTRAFLFRMLKDSIQFCGGHNE